MNPIHTTLIQTEGPHRVTVEPSDDGRWFRVLNWLTQSGIWAALPANQKAVLIPLHQHRSPSGLVLVPLSVIGQEAGLGRSATYDAIQGLLAHPAGLLARQGIALAVLPDRLFVGRPPPSATADTFPRRRKSALYQYARPRQASQKKNQKNWLGQNGAQRKTRYANT